LKYLFSSFVFLEKWGQSHIHYQADKLKRSPKLLKTIVQTFLPNEQALVASRISAAIHAIIARKFFRLEVIALEDFATRTTFLYNKLSQLTIQSRGSTMVPREVDQGSV
jgi:hypothetical protein